MYPPPTSSPIPEQSIKINSYLPWCLDLFFFFTNVFECTRPACHKIKSMHLDGIFLYSAVVSLPTPMDVLWKVLKVWETTVHPSETWFIAPNSFECSFRDMIHHEPWWVNILGKYYTSTYSSTHLLAISFKLLQFHRNFTSLLPWGLCYRKQASTAWITDYIQQYSVRCNYLYMS